VEGGVPLALINPAAADHRYVILHELMHHQLDELGCPSLWVTVRGSIPEGSWLGHNALCFGNFARGALVQLWELIQHSRFNRMLLRVFNCSPESARAAEYQAYIRRGYFQSFGLSTSGSHEHLTIEAAVHVATVLMEGSAVTQQEVLKFVQATFTNADQVLYIGQTISQAIREDDQELLQLDSRHLARMFSSMLADLQQVLSCLGTGMSVWVGEIRPLPHKFKDRCWTSAEVAMCWPECSMPPPPGFHELMPPRLADQHQSAPKLSPPPPAPQHHMPVARDPQSDASHEPSSHAQMVAWEADREKERESARQTDRNMCSTYIDDQADSERAPLMRGGGGGGTRTLVQMLPLEPAQRLAPAVDQGKESAEADVVSGGLITQLLARKKLPPGHYVMY
jgi:hypothetical protein